MRVCVFCGASDSVISEYIDIATECGELIANMKYQLIYGGGTRGLMKALATGAKSKLGHVIGVFPSCLTDLEMPHGNLDQFILAESLSERKRIMLEMADIFLILPGGIGTLDELFEVLIMRKVLLQDKPIIIFNYLGFWDELLALLSSLCQQGFWKEPLEKYEVVQTIEDLHLILQHYSLTTPASVAERTELIT